MRSQSKAEMMVGTALLIAEQSRSIVIPEVKQRIARLMVFAETLNALVLASEAACERTETGLYMPNQSIQHAGRVYAATNYYQAVQDLRDISGGALIVTPDRASFELPEFAADLNKYFAIEDVSAEARIRVLNLANDLTASNYAGRSQAYQIFAESPVYTQALIALWRLRQGNRRPTRGRAHGRPARVIRGAIRSPDIAPTERMPLAGGTDLPPPAPSHHHRHASNAGQPPAGS